MEEGAWNQLVGRKEQAQLRGAAVAEARGLSPTSSHIFPQPQEVGFCWLRSHTQVEGMALRQVFITRDSLRHPVLSVLPLPQCFPFPPHQSGRYFVRTLSWGAQPLGAIRWPECSLAGHQGQRVVVSTSLGHLHPLGASSLKVPGGWATKGIAKGTS